MTSDLNHNLDVIERGRKRLEMLRRKKLPNGTSNDGMVPYRETLGALSKYQRQSLSRPLPIVSNINSDDRVIVAKGGFVIKQQASPSAQVLPLARTIEPVLRLEKWTVTVFDMNVTVSSFNNLNPNQKLLKSSNFPVFNRNDLEAQGFYVGDIPNAAKHNIDKLTKRLQITSPTGPWFSDFYQLHLPPDPISFVQTKNLHEPRPYRTQQLEQTLPCMITEPSYCSLSLNSWIKQDYRLVIDLVGLQFTSHPLILEEQRLAIQIRTLVQTTIERKRSNVANFLAIKLKSLREYYQSIKDDYNKLNAQLPSSEGVMQMINTKKLDTLRIESERLQRKALKEIISVRLARDAENKSDMMLEFEIVKAWDLLKRIRKGTGLISTSLKLFIKAKKIKVENFDPKIEAKAEMQERIELYDLEVRNKRRQFSRSREQWLEQMRILENEGGETSSMENALSIQSLEKKASNISEPVEEAYEPFQKRKYKDEIKQRLKASHRPAESAILSFYVEETEAITPNISCTLEEQYRRSQVENTRYQLVLYYNQMKITTSNPKHLDPISFRMEAQNLKDNDWQPLVLKSANLPRSSFVIRVVEPPKSIAIEILECNPYGTSVVAKVYLPIPLSNELSTTKDRAVKNVEFCGDSDGFKFKGLTRYEGILKANTSWGVDSVGNVLGPTSQAPNKLKVRLPTHLYKLAQLMHWNDTLSFDRNDPRNYDLKQLRDLIDQKCSELGIDYISKNYFSLGIPDWLRKITVGISISEMDQERITLLRQRFGKNRGCNLSVSISGGLNENPKSHVLNSTRFYKKIRAEKLLKKALLAIPSHVDKYVHELRYEPIEQEPFWMLLLFRPNRPLNPVRNTRIQTVTSSPNQCKLLVQVSRALNIAKPIGSKEVRSFVEVSFQRKSVRSDTKTGINPLWNQTLKLSITSDTDFEPENLMKSDIVTEMVYINIFSESLVDILQDEGDRGSYIHNRIDRVWLGGMKLPFSQIWERTKIGGGFPIVIPSSLKLDRQLDDSGNVGKSVLHLFLTLDPPLLQPPKITLKFQTDEENMTVRYAENWVKPFISQNRNVLALAQTMQGKTTIVCRYISPLKPPENFDTLKKVVRFVAVIPFLDNKIAFSARCSLWSTADEIHALGSGDGIEHAILLCNYCLDLKLNAWVVLGSDLVDNNMAYVLVKKPKAQKEQTRRRSWIINSLMRGFDSEFDYDIYDPVNGLNYQIGDPSCPLLEMHCAFNSDNIWANVQADTNLKTTNLQFTDTSSWRPFFTASFPMKISDTIQPPYISYKKPSEDMDSMEMMIERAVVAEFEKWREGRLTRWNRLCSRSFKQLLRKYEHETVEGITLSLAENSIELGAINTVYDIYAFTLNVPFTDIAAICSELYITAIYNNNSPGVEFAFAVHCVAYPNNFTSVWIYLASLCRK